MSEDSIFNESVNSNAEISEGNDTSNSGSINNEQVGETVIGIAKTNAKARKKSVDDAQDAKINELIKDLQRTRADFENYRRQSEIQKNQYANVVKNTTIKKILPLIDDIERAIIANPDTLGPLAKNMDKTLKSIGLTKITSKVGDEFNPELHDAVLVEGDGESELIGETMRSGYYYENEVIRPAMVKVVKK